MVTGRDKSLHKFITRYGDIAQPDMVTLHILVHLPLEVLNLTILMQSVLEVHQVDGWGQKIMENQTGLWAI